MKMVGQGLTAPVGDSSLAYAGKDVGIGNGDLVLRGTMKRQRESRAVRINLVVLGLILHLLGASVAEGVRSEIPAEGWHDTHCVVSDDGKTVVWFHREWYDTRLCVVTYPFTKEPFTWKIKRLHPYASIRPILSGDGKRLFWYRSGLRYSRILNGKLSKVKRVQETKRQGGIRCVNRDGSRFAVVVGGPRVKGRASGAWTALAVASLEEGGIWNQSKLLSPAEALKNIDSPVMSSDGKTVVYTWDGKLFEWKDKTGVQPIPVIIPGARLEPTRLSADGKRFLFTAGRKGAKGGWLTTIHLTDKVNGAWQKPTLLLKDDNFSIWQLTMTADGRAIIFRKDYSKNRKRIKHNIQRIRLTKGTPAKPEVIVKLPINTTLFGATFENGISLSATGAMVYSMQTKRTPVTYNVFYVPKIQPNAKPINLSKLLVLKKVKEQERKKTQE